MKKKIVRSISLCLLAAALLGTAAFAAMDASKYIQTTTVSAGIIDGKVTAACTVTATGSYDDVGIQWIEFHKADGTLVEKHKYTDPGYSYLMDHDTAGHTAVVTGPTAEPNQKYYATVSFYAGQIGVAGGGYTMDSGIVPK